MLRRLGAEGRAFPDFKKDALSGKAEVCGPSIKELRVREEHYFLHTAVIDNKET